VAGEEQRLKTGLRFWRTSLALALLALAFGSPVAIADSRTLSLASDYWPPFTDQPGKRRVAIDLVHAALERTGLRADTQLRKDFASILTDLRKGELDGSVALWRSPEREKYLRFSRPYLENRLVLLGRRGTDVSHSDLAALKGKKVGIVGGYAYGPNVQEAKGPKIVVGASDQDNFDALLRGELDYILVDDLVVHDVFERYGDRAEVLLSAGHQAIVNRPLHFAIRKDLADSASIIARFDETIATMIADGSYHRLLHLTWIRVDLDGDGDAELVLDGTSAGENPPETGYGVPGPDGRPSGTRSDDPGYVIERKEYPDWQSVPDRYKVQSDKGVAYPDPGIRLLQF
jgi:polar amino acid transport system substrate-binding protein